MLYGALAGADGGTAQRSQGVLVVHVCIVGGFPRAGTRQFTDVLNAHPDVRVHGEIPRGTLRKVGELFVQADADYSGRWSRQFFERRRARAALVTIAALGKGKPRGPRLDVKKAVVGFKTPWVELDHTTLRLLFRGERPTFYYCVRNLRDNFLSARAVLNKSPENYLGRTRQSLATALHLMDDPDFDLRVLSLDDFLGCEDAGTWLATNLFGALPIDGVVPGQATRYFGSTTNRNATVRKLGTRRPKTLEPAVQKLLADDQELARLSGEFQKRTGVDLAATLVR